MDSATVAYLVAGMVGLLSTGALIFVQRQMALSDAASLKKDQDNDAHFRDQGIRIGDLSAKVQSLELMLADKVSYDKFDNVQREWKQDLKDFKAELLAAIHKGV